MAGIGFTLRRMLQEGGFWGPGKAFAYATAISAGPWLSSSLTLAVLGGLSALAPESHDSAVFLAIVSYAFAFSLMGVGACQMVASRFLADRLYEGDTAAFAPSFVQLLAPLLVIQAMLAVGFFSFVPLPPVIEGLGVLLYLALNGTWLAMVYLSAAHDYQAIAWSFLAGFAVSLGAGTGLGVSHGLTGQLAGFTAGALLTFFALLARIDREFGLPGRADPRLWAYFRRYWPLAVTGLAYNAGVWIDKVLFWYHPDTGRSVAGILHYAPVYDNAMFLAYLTIIPALALFLLKVETDFYDQYRRYFSTIAARESLEALLRVKARMAVVLRDQLGLLLKVQGTVTVAVVVGAPELAELFKLSWLSLFVFRAGVLGALLHVLALFVMILLLYFDYRPEAMTVALCLFGLNTLLTLASFAGGLGAYGFGYAAASALTLLVALVLLERALRDLEYHVFMKQPL